MKNAAIAVAALLLLAPATLHASQLGIAAMVGTTATMTAVFGGRP